jgi:PHP family Zn ribbon phosphoesterase
VYAFASDLKRLAERVERLEELLNLRADDPEFEEELKKMICERDGHKYTSVQYDLQGGKWGTERCSRCRHEYSWSV